MSGTEARTGITTSRMLKLVSMNAEKLGDMQLMDTLDTDMHQQTKTFSCVILTDLAVPAVRHVVTATATCCQCYLTVAGLYWCCTRHDCVECMQGSVIQIVVSKRVSAVSPSTSCALQHPLHRVMPAAHCDTLTASLHSVSCKHIPHCTVRAASAQSRLLPMLAIKSCII